MFHTFWGGPPIPAEFLRFRDRWAELHPGWAVLVWSDETYQREIMPARTADFYCDPTRWSPKSSVWQWRADLARYEILAKMGGVWIDADLEPLRPIDPIIEQAEGGAFAAREDARHINNAFMGCEPDHPFLVDVLGGLPDRVTRNRHLRVNRSIGAGYLTVVAERHPGLLVLPRELIYPFSYTELHRRGEKFPDAFTVHHWNNRTQGEARRRARR
jgi:mannosyltransferase OCH1-like enzyme